MSSTKTLKHRGVTIAPVKVTRYEVRNAAGKTVKTFAKLATARAWVDGYVRALQRYAPKEPTT